VRGHFLEDLLENLLVNRASWPGQNLRRKIWNWPLFKEEIIEFWLNLAKLVITWYMVGQSLIKYDLESWLDSLAMARINQYKFSNKKMVKIGVKVEKSRIGTKFSTLRPILSNILLRNLYWFLLIITRESNQLSKSYFWFMVGPPYTKLSWVLPTYHENMSKSIIFQNLCRLFSKRPKTFFVLRKNKLCHKGSWTKMSGF
jgi:hypothetical protein